MDTASGEFGLLVQNIKATRPDVESVIDVVSFRPLYRFFPARLTLKLADRGFTTEVLKTSNERKSLQSEINVLNALREIGLPVPQVTSSIFEFVENGVTCWGIFLQELDGHALEWLGLNDLIVAGRTCELTIEAVGHLQSLTDKVLQHPIASVLPKRVMIEEFNIIKRDAGAWAEASFFQAALETIEDILPQVTIPLTFSNGDYNPLNFISNNDEIVGWIDFEHACFEDPHIGFAKFLLWADDTFGWATGAKAGLVERYLFINNVRPCDFYCRIVLRGLYYIHLRSVEEPPRYMIDVVTLYADKLKGLKQKCYLTSSSTGQFRTEIAG